MKTTDIDKEDLDACLEMQLKISQIAATESSLDSDIKLYDAPLIAMRHFDIEERIHAALNARFLGLGLQVQGSKEGAARQFQEIASKNSKIGLDWDEIRRGTELTVK